MKKIKKILIASILIIGIVIGVTYANLQKGANSTETENKLFINTNPDNIGIILGDSFFRNWSLSMPNSSIDLRRHNDTHDSFSMVYNDTELFSFIVERNTSSDIKDMLISLVDGIYYCNNDKPQDVLISNSNEFYFTEYGLIYHDEIMGIWCNPV